MLLNIAIISAVIITGLILMWPRLSRLTLWRATITPLASIIGSGFLVLGPILDASYGRYAPLVMIGLCGFAYLFGGAIRFNIATLDAAPEARGVWEHRLESLSSWCLAFAYFISVAYYLNLFGSFGVSLTPTHEAVHAKLLTSAVFVFILIVGWVKGFAALERMEQVSVGVKLSIIVGLLVGLVVFFAKKASAGALLFYPPTQTGWAGLTLAFGLLVTVQGFETSRYLGDTYDAQTRIRSMRLAQWLATTVYIIYIALIAYVFTRGQIKLTETAIIDLMVIVAPILPALLVAAALSAQFSAAVADTSGAGGLLTELTKERLKPKHAYALLVLAGLLLTWTANVFEIISYASRAFALYYALQTAIAGISAFRSKEKRYLAPLFWALTLLALAIVLFGKSVEA